jgi:hypothetical protein
VNLLTNPFMEPGIVKLNEYRHGDGKLQRGNAKDDQCCSRELKMVGVAVIPVRPLLLPRMCNPDHKHNEAVPQLPG